MMSDTNLKELFFEIHELLRGSLPYFDIDNYDSISEDDLKFAINDVILMLTDYKFILSGFKVERIEEE